MSTTAEQIANAQTITDLPPFWGEVASLAGTVPLVDAKILAGYFKRPKKEIEGILEHPLVQEHVEHLKSEVALRLSQETNTMTAARSLSIQLIHEHLQQYGSSMKVSELSNVLKMLNDYHPDRRYVKVEKREEHRVIEHKINEHALETLKQRALENFNRVPVEALSVSATGRDIGLPVGDDDEGDVSVDDAAAESLFVDDEDDPSLDGEAIEKQLLKQGAMF